MPPSQTAAAAAAAAVAIAASAVIVTVVAVTVAVAAATTISVGATKIEENKGSDLKRKEKKIIELIKEKCSFLVGSIRNWGSL